jgi:hypothetical protein
MQQLIPDLEKQMRTEGYRRKPWFWPATIVVSVAGIGQILALQPARAQSSPFDGSYLGTQTLTERSEDANFALCLRGPFKRTLVVRSGAVSYTYNPTYHSEVAGTVSADGDVSAEAATPEGGVKLSGKIQGNEFTGEVWSIYCTYAVKLTRHP